MCSSLAWTRAVVSELYLLSLFALCVGWNTTWTDELRVACVTAWVVPLICCNACVAGQRCMLSGEYVCRQLAVSVLAGMAVMTH